MSRMFSGSGVVAGGLVGLLLRGVEFGSGVSYPLGPPILLVVVWGRGA